MKGKCKKNINLKEKHRRKKTQVNSSELDQPVTLDIRSE